MTEPGPARPGFIPRWFPNAEWVLLLLLGAEISVFGMTGDHFLSAANGFEIVRLAAEVGLLALGLTPVIKSGGIDLSVGSMMGLAAVILGSAWSALGVPLGIAMALALLAGAAGGALHGFLITRLRVPPLIATLGTFSLYRGVAEAMTGGYVSYSGFPRWFLDLGQGYIGGVVPAQLPVVGAVFIALWLLMHRATIGREITAIGFNSAGARFAGVRVGAVTLRVYVICGLCSALAAMLYVARPTRDWVMNWWPSRRWCWGARRSWAAAVRSTARCSGCFASSCCKTDSVFPASPARLPDSAPALFCWPQSSLIRLGRAGNARRRSPSFGIPPRPLLESSR
jgi:ribose/xylose/arabinose/galactoside ABC-type transport system permease subunit